MKVNFYLHEWDLRYDNVANFRIYINAFIVSSESISRKLKIGHLDLSLHTKEIELYFSGYDDFSVKVRYQIDMFFGCRGVRLIKI